MIVSRRSNHKWKQVHSNLTTMDVEGQNFFIHYRLIDVIANINKAVYTPPVADEWAGALNRNVT